MNNQKGFANIALIVLVVVLVGAVGYFALNNRSATPTSTPSITNTNEQPTPTPSPTPTPTATPSPTPKPTPKPTPTPIPTSWQFIDANSFSLSLPPGWKFNKLQGTDSYIGEFVGDGARLFFDLGWYSSPGEEDNDPKYFVTYETIDGYRAKIVVPKVMGNGTTGIYFTDLGNQNRFSLSGSNLTASQQETALKIFRTIKFKK